MTNKSLKIAELDVRANIAKQQGVKYLNQQEQVILHNAFQKYAENASPQNKMAATRYYLFYFFLRESGARISEMNSVDNVRDYDENTGTIQIITLKQFKKKRTKDRIPARVVEQLEALMNTPGIDEITLTIRKEDLLDDEEKQEVMVKPKVRVITLPPEASLEYFKFIKAYPQYDVGGERAGQAFAVDRSNFANKMKELGKKAGLPADICHPHSLRHTFAVNQLIAGSTIDTIGKLLGHTDQKTTDIYTQLATFEMNLIRRQQGAMI